MDYTVKYFMKGMAKQFRHFATGKEAVDFMKELSVCYECESFRLVRAKYKISLYK